MNRRDFGRLTSALATSTLAATALGTAAGARTAMALQPTAPWIDDKQPGWIDAHVHVWTPDTKKYPIDASFTVADMKPASFTPEELFEHCKPAGVSRIVLIQMSFYKFDNRYMLDMMAAHPGVFGGVAIVNHETNDTKALTEELRKLHGAGVRA